MRFLKRFLLMVVLAGCTGGAWTVPPGLAAEAGASAAGAAEPARVEPHGSGPFTVEEIARRVRDSIVTIRHVGRSGKAEGLGTGFVVSPEGLIATNLHVIGEARPVSVQLADGRRFDVTEVHASDRSADLAVVRIAADGLAALPIGDPARLADGQEVVAVGHPLGLERTVVAGRVSGRRRIDDRDMIQLAIPIEQGNSGGPLLDLFGNVHGVLTLKSTLAANIGFALTIDQLEPLLANPNPVTMARWITIGALDPAEWSPVGGANWRQRAGRISVRGAGEGFGGRSLCLAAESPAEEPYEVAAWVRLDDESGAAGLAFASDGGDRHYGFYPSAGKLRLTRFDGPDVMSWRILHDAPSPAYRAGEWNHLRVRREPDRILCYVNDQLCVESADAGLVAGRVGLAKFRDTEAEFRGFAAGPSVSRAAPSEDVMARVAAILAPGAHPAAGDPAGGAEEATGGYLPGGDHTSGDLIDRLLSVDAGESAVLARATALEREASRLRGIAALLQERRALDDLAVLGAAGDDAIDPFRGALLIARLDNPDLDAAGVERDLDRIAGMVRAGLPEQADDATILAALDETLFSEMGFHGSRGDYYNRSNSYINEVLDDREGIPITLSVVYMAIARRLGVTVDGIGLPGHFVVRHAPADGEPRWIDVFDRARTLSRDDLARLVRDAVGEDLADRHLAVAPPRAILVRMLNNLLSIASREDDSESMLRYLDAILALDGDSVRERVMHMIVAGRAGRNDKAAASGRWLLEHAPEGIDLEKVREVVESAERR
jgi:serine protease Do